MPFGEVTDRVRAIAVEDGRVYGRGACDAKGSLVAMLMALRTLRDQRQGLRVNVQVAAMVNEEHTFQGVFTYLQQLPPGARPMAAIVGEPTGLEVVIAHKGVLRFRLHTLGRAVHTSRAADGVNAIDKMAAVRTALRANFSPIHGAAPAAGPRQPHGGAGRRRRGAQRGAGPLHGSVRSAPAARRVTGIRGGLDRCATGPRARRRPHRAGGA